MNNENNGLNPVNPMMPNQNPVTPGMTPDPMNPNPMGPVQTPTPEVTPTTPVMEPNPMGPVQAPTPEVTPTTPVMEPNPMGPVQAPTPEVPTQAPGMTPNPMGPTPMPNTNPNMMGNTMPTEAPKKNNTTFIIIVAVLVVAIIGAVLYFVLGNKSETPAPTPTPSQDTTPAPVVNANTYTVNGYVVTVPEGYNAQVEGTVLTIAVPGKYYVQLTFAKYANYSDFVGQVDELKNTLAAEGVTVTGGGEKSYGGKTWLTADGTMVAEGMTLYAGYGVTECTNGVAAVSILTNQSDLNEIFGVLNTIINGATPDTASFAPNGTPESIVYPSLAGKTL